MWCDLCILIKLWHNGNWLSAFTEKKYGMEEKRREDREVGQMHFGGQTILLIQMTNWNSQMDYSTKTSTPNTEGKKCHRKKGKSHTHTTRCDDAVPHSWSELVFPSAWQINRFTLRNSALFVIYIFSQKCVQTQRTRSIVSMRNRRWSHLLFFTCHFNGSILQNIWIFSAIFTMNQQMQMCWPFFP